MVHSLKASLLGLVALCALAFTFNFTAQAQDKKSKCELCDEVKVVLESMRCEKCKPDKQCDACAEKLKKAEERYLCKNDKDKACDVCEAALKADKCKFCAAKTYIISHTYCCATCEKKGDEAAQKCAKCTDARAPYTKIECKEKDCPNKKK